MKVVVIHPTARKGSTYNVAQRLLDKLSQTEQLEIERVRLLREAPRFCTGCFLCFNEGGHRCPHVSAVQPLEQKLHAADLIIVCSPVYAGGVPAQLKALLDHLSYSELMHKPHPAMFSKVAVTIVLSAGKGQRTTSRYLDRTLADLGISTIFSITTPIAADAWEKVTAKRVAWIDKKVDALSPRIIKAVRRPRVSVRTRVLFNLSRFSIKKWGWNESDVAYWDELGWLGEARPWRPADPQLASAQPAPAQTEPAVADSAVEASPPQASPPTPAHQSSQSPTGETALDWAAGVQQPTPPEIESVSVRPRPC